MPAEPNVLTQLRLTGIFSALPTTLSVPRGDGPPRDRRENRVARPYETVLILDSSLDESQVEEKLARLKRAIDGGEDRAVSVTHWGKRKLAYPIGRKEQGLYVILRYETEPESLTELERLARIDEQVLRHLTIVDPVEPAEPAVHREDDKDEEV